MASTRATVSKEKGFVTLKFCVYSGCSYHSQLYDTKLYIYMRVRVRARVRVRVRVGVGVGVCVCVFFLHAFLHLL